jgi:hypothetical protein
VASSDTNAGTGTYKVTEDYLKNYSVTQIKAFLAALGTDPGVTGIARFADGSDTGLVDGGYGKLLPGGSALGSATQLQSRFKQMAGQLKTATDAFGALMNQTLLDLQTVDTVLTGGEDAADITAQEMLTDLGDVLGPLLGTGTTTTPKPNPPTGTPR